MLVSTLVPSMSAYNNIEKRMVPLRQALAGVLLPHDTFDTHLDSQRRTTEVELEKQNFKAAGKLLAEIWSELVLDKFPVVSEYVEGLALDLVPINETWVATQCHISQYFLQIAKCTKWECCGEFHTSWLKLFPQQFLLVTVPFWQLGKGPEVLSVNDARPTDRFLGLWKRNIIDLLVPNSKYYALPYNICEEESDQMHLYKVWYLLAKHCSVKTTSQRLQQWNSYHGWRIQQQRAKFRCLEEGGGDGV